MLQSVLNSFFGCSHTQTTFPLTPKRGSSGTYVVCLDCGKEFAYDWKSMRVGQPVPVIAPVPVVEAQPSYR